MIIAKLNTLLGMSPVNKGKFTPMKMAALK